MHNFFRFFLFILLISISANARSVDILSEKETLIKADTIYYAKQDELLILEGNVEILYKKSIIKTHKAYIDIKNNTIKADGIITVTSKEKKIRAASGALDSKNHTFEFDNVIFQLNNADLLTSSKVIRSDFDNYILENAKFTPCISCIHKFPIWEINADKTSVNLKNKTIKYKNARLKFFGKTVFFTPYFSHPTYDAEAKSGFLKPEIDNGNLKIPFYLRVKDNLDLTYTPRFNKKILINELELRHKLESGEYKIKGSYNRSLVTKSRNNVKIKNKVLDRYFVESSGKFGLLGGNMGFNFAKVSDKSYLKNLYQDDRNFIKSNLYYNNFIDNGYTNFSMSHYQGLRAIDSVRTDPSALPQISIRRDIDLGNAMDISVKESFLNYSEGDTKKISRNSLALDLNKNIYSDSGAKIDYGISNRFDIYKVHNTNQQHKTIKNKVISRNIPEFHAAAKIPKYFDFKNFGMIIEPEASLFYGIDNPKKISRFNLIDSPNVDLSENNLFESSKYSGIDYHEYGKRLNYGVNNNFFSDDYSISTFIGQSITSDKEKNENKSNFVGRLSLKISDSFEIYYRFQKRNRRLKPQRDEVLTWINFDKFSFYNNYTILKNLKNNNEFYYQATAFDKNIIKQNYTYSDYKLTKYLKVFGDIRIDFAGKDKANILSSGFGAKFDYDCISLYTKISNDYTSDSTRNIKKTRSYTFKIGLKSISF
jgi:LPS-assembly protein